MTIDMQIKQALKDAKIAIAKQDRLRELNMRSAEIKATIGKGERIMSEGTRQKLLSLVMRRIWG